VEDIVMAEKRERIEPHRGDKRLQRRDARGRFSESDDLRKAAAQDPERDAEHEAPQGQGDRGDREH
jgi:hypothetical protein